MIGGSISPQELVEYWAEHPSDLPLSTVVKLCVENGYSIPAARLAELETIEAHCGSVVGGSIVLAEPDMPASYRRGASMDDPLVSERGQSGGILADEGASGVFVQGGSDMGRGIAAASLLLAMQVRYRTSDVGFVDWANMIDKCRAAPLYGPGSATAALNPLKDVSVLVLHGVDCYANSRDGAEALGKVLRPRAASDGKTIMTSSVAWPVLGRTVGEASDLRGYLAACVAKSDHRPNVVSLTDERG